MVGTMGSMDSLSVLRSDQMVLRWVVPLDRMVHQMVEWLANYLVYVMVECLVQEKVVLRDTVSERCLGILMVSWKDIMLAEMMGFLQVVLMVENMVLVKALKKVVTTVAEKD